jgi:hypothetical protein
MSPVGLVSRAERIIDKAKDPNNRQKTRCKLIYCRWKKSDWDLILVFVGQLSNIKHFHWWFHRKELQRVHSAKQFECCIRINFNGSA